jgi:hypothetical protein
VDEKSHWNGLHVEKGLLGLPRWVFAPLIALSLYHFAANAGRRPNLLNSLRLKPVVASSV